MREGLTLKTRRHISKPLHYQYPENVIRRGDDNHPGERTVNEWLGDIRRAHSIGTFDLVSEGKNIGEGVTFALFAYQLPATLEDLLDAFSLGLRNLTEFQRGSLLHTSELFPAEKRAPNSNTGLRTPHLDD